MSKVIGGRYEILSELGSGGMQHVFRAHDLLRGVDVALKTPQAGQLLKKFANSATISARINHHNVAKTLDYFEEDAAPYLAEELIEGGTLDEACLSPAGFVDPHTGARLFRLLAKGLAASHHAGVVHRDLKPSNIVVSGGYNLSSVKITDFGIATLTEEVFEEEIVERGDITKTTSGTVKGALPYMAPEMMFRKKGDYVGREADVWSLGAVMFHMLTGVLPFDEGLIVPANVKTGARAPWPVFMTNDLQFSSLARSLQELVEASLQYDAAKRPTADDLMRACNELMYYNGTWITGKVSNMPGSTIGFIFGADGKMAFFHRDSTYGPRKPGVGDKVLYSCSDGTPHQRAFPLIVCK
ncbi:serine/threonine-protein kinase [Mesorhizobium sp. ES1-4]|uniref:serine/threonine-protein kinase n=1 Tax=Mesorhizobium sp. ES1-4 TaxID=2876627 RepID=UPI001CCABE41|nr:serine/threonine-protein kinase [Mesorhizobium sp. ES1-4]MBZ9795735.1 serine/threonine protein kinase [Mesorhizobium sp. ES1-4]